MVSEKASIESQLQELQSHMASRASEVQELRDALCASKTETEALQMSLESEKKAMLLLNTENERMEREIKDTARLLHEKESNLMERIAAQDAVINDTHSKLGSLSSMIDVASTCLRQITGSNVSSEAIDQLSRNVAGFVEALRSEKDSLDKSMATLASQKESVQNENASLKSKVDGLHSQLKSLESDYMSLKEENKKVLDATRDESVAEKIALLESRASLNLQQFEEVNEKYLKLLKDYRKAELKIERLERAGKKADENTENILDRMGDLKTVPAPNSPYSGLSQKRNVQSLKVSSPIPQKKVNKRAVLSDVSASDQQKTKPQETECNQQ